MPRGSTIVVENNFSKGLITEFTAMNFPENAVTDADNVVFSEFGKVTRRPGIDLELDNQALNVNSLSPHQGAFVEFKWDSVGSDGTTSFLVQQIGTHIRFFSIGSLTISGQLKPFFVDLTDHKTNVDDDLIAQNPCQFSFGKGYLFIVHPFCEPMSVEYFSDSDTINIEEIKIEIRDFERLKDGLKVDERPTTPSPLHQYNLYNQGWDDKIKYGWWDNSPQAYQAWTFVRKDYPSNADVWWTYKNAMGLAHFGEGRVEGPGGVYFVNPSMFAIGNTPAPNGRYIYSAWDINRTEMTGIDSLPNQSSGNSRPSVTAFYAGRIFYAGVSADKYSDKLYFSQIIQSEDQFGKCYQANDPTSELIFDLLDSDGGVISLPLVSKIVSLQVLNDALIVVGTNGIFAIRGTQNGPFKATDYSVEYVSDVGGVSDLSIINVDNSLIWWNYDALYALSKDNIGVFYQVQSASKTTIQSVIDQVPSDNRPYIKGAYNKKDRIVQWLYNDQLDASPYTYNRILEMNVSSKAFYTHTISTDKSPRLVGIISVSGQSESVFQVDVLDNNGVKVVDNNFFDVFVNQGTFVPNIEKFKYSTLYQTGLAAFSYSDQKAETQDWLSLLGSTFFSYFYSGYRIRGEMLRSFSSNPISVVLDNGDDYEVIYKSIYDYGSRESMPQWLYTTARNQDALHNRVRGDFLIRKIKPRGKGKAFQLYFQSDGDAPFSIIGWSTLDSGGQIP